jgi:prepilin-type N-terminal cleavage/methylation domain-containing protein
LKALAKLMKKVRQGEGGLTLIEILIVLLILSILVAVVVFNVGGFIGQGTEEIAKMQGNLVQTAIVAAMAAESAANVVEGYIGDVGDGTSLTNPAVWELTVDSTNVTMSKYVQSAITGYWKWDDSGVIIEGEYTGGGGTTCTYNATDGWDCP